MKFKGHEISVEQEFARSQFLRMRRGDMLTLAAGAGASKTYTCNLLLSSTKETEKCLVIAFNRLIVDEMCSSFGENVDVLTSHELARKYVTKYSTSRLERPLLPKMVVDALGIPATVGTMDAFSFSQKLVWGIKKYANSEELNIARFARINGAEILKSCNKTDLVLFAMYLNRLWIEMTTANSNLPIIHDVYLKEFVMMVVSGDITLDEYKVVVLDEAQDSAPIVKLLFAAINSIKVGAGDTHQSIYEWRGAVNVMRELGLQSKYTAELTTCYRFGQSIADLANALIEEYKGSNPKFKGHPTKISEIKVTPKNEAKELWLFRTNAELISELIYSTQKGVKCHLLRDNKSMIKLIDEAQKLYLNQPVKSGVLKLFDSWSEFEAFATSGDGGEYKSFVDAVLSHGFDAIKKVIENSLDTDIEDAERLFSTAHACKGIEHNHVVLHSDFDKFIEKSLSSALEQEINLLYVALTRAIKTLDISRCKTLTKLLTKNDERVNSKAMDMKRRELASLGL